ncbi:MAG TPA: sugar ABC transporter permease [Acidisoma sp.]|uniref:carbohydrate ABC transporter permease n=1 Tax=Acidisoma sp. TaxID=1872115 RepID=UPI002C94F346|nr:sugar ABC transporter permease [Acidisoma sp.]HTI00969.1 sugar ABC transporter permease [Acidisoma sp.]
MSAALSIDEAEALPRKKRRNMLPLLLLAPSVVLLTVLVAFPLVFSLKNSFYFWNLQMSPQPLGFIGLGNYKAAIVQSDFLEALWHTFAIAVVGTLIEVAAGLAIAHLLMARLVGVNLCRTLLIMPTTIAPIVTGFLFRYLYDAQGGLIPWLLHVAHIPIPAQGLLGSGETALWAILAADIWQWTPFCAIVLYAGLLSVPDDILEAARIDGASSWTILWRMTLPMIRKPLSFVAALRLMQIFNLFDLVLVLTRGGPGSTSRTLSYNLYQQGLVDFNIGLSSASTWMIVILVNILIGLFAIFAFRDIV